MLLLSIQQIQGFCRIFSSSAQSHFTEQYSREGAVSASGNNNRFEKMNIVTILTSQNEEFDCIEKKKQLLHFLTIFSVHLSTALTTVFLTILLNMIGPSSLNCQASIIPWMNSAALILVLAIKCAQRYVQGSHCKDKHSFQQVGVWPYLIVAMYFLTIKDQLME